MGAFKSYTIGLLVLTFSAAMMLNFSGSVFQTYNTQVQSDTLQSVKDQAETAEPRIGQKRNQTASISPEEGSFLSPQAFGVVSSTLSSAGDMFAVVDTAVGELGLPTQIVALLVGIVTLRLIWEGVSALFGWDV